MSLVSFLHNAIVYADRSLFWQHPAKGWRREVSPRAHRGAWVIGTDALRILVTSREPSDGQERKQNNKDDPNINAHQSSTESPPGVALIMSGALVEFFLAQKMHANQVAL